ncbi:MAG: XTP/dITP diphosphatase [Acidobacteria bacterium]|nr:XTP/dITP diphosphatase [Acidobacteriota bacterium]MBI3424855.1 XTP/dITP diphosphatase [Acidobacteriota bacterium]
MTKLLIATTNAGKVAEIMALLTDLNYEVLGLADLPQPLPDVEETGETFAANAMLKAEYYHAQTGWLTLADDSGLEVDALGGRPGVYSARYAGAGAGDAAKVAKLLEELRDVPADQRTARFVCVIALTGPGVRETFTGACAGVIADAPRGTNGFGYDPVFIEPSSKRTFAELTRAEKAALSHRGQALKQVKDWLRQAELQPK